MKLELRPEQQQVMSEVSAAFRAGHKRVMVSACCGFGKCHAKGTKVVLADGTMREVELIEPGDELASPTGGFRTVLSIGRGREEMFRVTPVKGDPYVVNGSHILSLIVSGTTPINLADGSRWAPGEVVAVDVRTYLRSNKTARNCLKGWRPARVDFEHADFGLTVPPYILGAWLGDGSAKVTAITKPPCRMVDEWVAWGASLGCTASVDTFGGRCQTVRLVTPRGQPNPAQDALRELGLLGKKRIPHRYLTGSYETRMELLAGLLDSDGHHCRGCYDWISKSESMARDFAFLARSLGFSAYLSAQRKGIKSRGFSAIYWRCSVSGDSSRIPCRDKKADERRINKNHLVTGIKSVESLGQGDYYGFELDGDHLYLLEDFTVCHNTELATAMLAATAENGKRGAFLADRRALVEQTIQRFDKYGLEAGVIMADHHRFAPSRLIQVCSVQTLLRRRWPDANLLFIDEAHVLSEAVRKKLEAKDCYAIGLSATPLTRGLGKYFDVVVNAPTTNRMIEMGRLVPVSIHSFKQPDMRAADVSSTGEWVGKKAEKEVLEVVGDVVQKYLDDGQGAKFVCFAWNIAHAVELSRQFLAAGINTATYTADDRPEDRHESVQEFKLPDSSIRGLISVAALSRGFDETSVSLMIDARPLRKAVHEYVQMMGRVMRAHPGKEVATVYDHSGNAVRFWEDWNNLFEFGVNKLDDGKPKPKQKTEPKQPEPVKCSQCGHLHRPQPFCPSCGHEYPRKASVQHVPGTLKELIAGKYHKELDKQLWPMVKGYVLERREGDAARKQALAIYKDMTGAFPNAYWESTTPVPPTLEVRNRIRSQQIRWVRGREKAQAVAA